jgi:methyl-accepting chemotaxis protein
MKRFWSGNRRRNVLSNPGVQIRIIAIFVTLALLFACTNYYVSKRALRSLYDDLAGSSLPDAARMDLTASFQQQNGTLDAQLALLTVLSLVVLTLSGLFLSHSLGGPIHRLTGYCRNVASGRIKPARLRFRRHDFFHDLIEAFNEFQDSRGILPKSDPGDGDRSGPRA